jgi:hypothetical protein
MPPSTISVVAVTKLDRSRSRCVRARAERLSALRDALATAKQGYWAEQTEIQRQAVIAWATRVEGRPEEALALMLRAVELEDPARSCRHVSCSATCCST